MDFGLIFRTRRRRDETPPLEEGERRFFLELLIVVAIVSALLALYLQEFRIALEKTMLIEAFSITQQPRGEAIVHHAARGAWPDQLETKASGKYVSAVRWSKNSLVSELVLPGTSEHQNSPRTVSFAPATNQGPASAIIWLCGHAEPPPGFVRKADSITSAPVSILPLPCRPRRQR